MTGIALWAALKRFWPAIPCIALLIALMLTRASLASVRHELTAAKSALSETEANYRAAAAERKASDIANAERVKAAGDTASKEVLNDYQARVDALRRDFAERVRIATAAHPGSPAGADLPAVPGTPVSANAAACQAQFPAQDALVASEQAEQLVALQSWVRSVSGIDVNGR